MSFDRIIPLACADTLWLSRCPAPTLTGIALAQGRLERAFAGDGLRIRILQQERNPAFHRQGYYHDLKYLFREGGNYPAFAARAAGHDTSVVVGLSWVDEAQLLLARPDSGLARGDLSVLNGRILGLSRAPGGYDIWRAMGLRGYDTALRLGGLGLQDAILKDLPVTPDAGSDQAWPRVSEAALLAGEVDVIYAKGASGVALQRAHHLDIVLDINTIRDPRYRINNGTPRPITVHRHLLDDQPELVAGFLSVLLETEAWARQNGAEVAAIVAGETGASAADVRAAYGLHLHDNLGVSLDQDRVAAFQDQGDFLYRHGLIDRAVDIGRWVNAEPLTLAMAAQAEKSLAIHRV